MKKTIVIADDDPICLKLVERDLTQAGYEVVTAQDGTQAIDKIKALRPSLVILDIFMPHLHGSEVASKMKEDPSLEKIPIIFLTGILSKREEEELAPQLTSQSVIAKPYGPKQLLELVQRKIS